MERPCLIRIIFLLTICTKPEWDRSSQVTHGWGRGSWDPSPYCLICKPLMDCWGGEATVFSCEITGEPPVSLGGPGQTQRGTDKTKRNDEGKRLAAKLRYGVGREGYKRGCGGSERVHYILVWNCQRATLIINNNLIIRWRAAEEDIPCWPLATTQTSTRVHTYTHK